MSADLFPEIAKKNTILQAPLLKNTCLVVYLIMSGSTLNLWKLKSKAAAALHKSRTSAVSHHRRIIRFLSKGEAIRTKLLALNYALLEEYHHEKYLILDGTVWKTQRYEYNFQTLALLVNGRSIPIWFKDLMRVGASRIAQRKALFDDALNHLDLKGKVLLADREYIGREWFKYLSEKGIGFTIRVRDGHYKSLLPKGTTMNNLHKQAHEHGISFCQLKLDAIACTYVVIHLSDGNFLKLLTTESVEEARASYRLRYRIETMFKHMKTNGFNMEDMHLVKEDRCNVMVCCMMLAYTMTICYDEMGYTAYLQKKSDKKVKDKMSAFMWGRDHIGYLLSSLGEFIDKTQERFNIWGMAKEILVELMDNELSDSELARAS